MGIVQGQRISFCIVKMTILSQATVGILIWAVVKVRITHIIKSRLTIMYTSPFQAITSQIQPIMNTLSTLQSMTLPQPHCLKPNPKNSSNP
jgi:hypothetical protein